MPKFLDTHDNLHDVSDEDFKAEFRGVVVPPVAPAPKPTAANVDAERDRRLATVPFRFGDHLYQSRMMDIIYISGAAGGASAAIANGVQENDFRWSDPAKDFEWIAFDNSLVPMDAPTMIAFGQKAMRWVDDHVKAGLSIKSLPVIPDNYKDDQLWPQTG